MRLDPFRAFARLRRAAGFMVLGSGHLAGAAGGGAWPARLAAQDNALVEAVAPILAAEDARHWAHGTLRAGMHSPEPLVRRSAALAIGRIGHPAGLDLLVHALTDPDSLVQAAVFFALGLMRDSTASPLIVERFQAQPPLASNAATEAVTALAKIGGPVAADFIAALIRGTATITTEPDQPLRQAALEAWRLGDHAPSNDLIALHSTDDDLRWRILYSLGRLRPAGASARFLDALRDPYAPVRHAAARSLTQSYIASEGLAEDGVIELLKQAADDEDAGVRIQAIRSLASYDDASPPLGAFLRLHVDDAHAGVRMQALSALGLVGGPEAAALLLRTHEEGKTFAGARLALLGLAQVDEAGFRRVAGRWSGSGDWRERAVAAEAWYTLARRAGGGGGGTEGTTDATRPDFLNDPDGRVVATALEAWGDAVEQPVAAMIAAARRLLQHPDAVVRAVAADVLERAPDPADVSSLARMVSRAERDSIPDAAVAALRALRAVYDLSDEGRAAVSIQFLAGTTRPENSVLRGWAERAWPELAARWGPAFPIETRRTLQDYRALARRFVVNQTEDAYPHVFIETAERGTIELELFGPDAPLTVANFLSLVDRRFFDGNRWHRVIPDFVVQDGDPRGDGWGGPGGSIRDEINPRRYGTAAVGMALSGPDTGSSQWFITMSPQPHLDGTYTVFGRVVGNVTPLFRILQGDLIRTIHR